MKRKISDGEVLLAIPARGGSKRLPRKNITLLSGIPMLRYTVEAAQNSGLSSRVYVCTEDEEIADLSATFGATVFRIPKNMAGDEVSSTVPCMHLYKELVGMGQSIKYIFNLQPTSPLRTGEDIKKAFQILTASGADFLVSVTPVDPHYFHWALVEPQKEDSPWRMYFGDKYLDERTRLGAIYRPNGAIKLGLAEKISQTGNFFGESLTTYYMPEERSIHVATLFDLKCAEAMLSTPKAGGS